MTNLNRNSINDMIDRLALEAQAAHPQISDDCWVFMLRSLNRYEQLSFRTTRGDLLPTLLEGRTRLGHHFRTYSAFYRRWKNDNFFLDRIVSHSPDYLQDRAAWEFLFVHMPLMIRDHECLIRMQSDDLRLFLDGDVDSPNFKALRIKYVFPIIRLNRRLDKAYGEYVARQDQTITA